MSDLHPTGQRQDLQRLLNLHEKLGTQEGGVVLVCGPRGVGKVPLLESLRSSLTQQGRLVLMGRATQTSSLPYALFREPAAQALAFLETRGKAAEFLDAHSQALSVLVPSLSSLQSRAHDRTSFFEALRAFFIDLSKISPPTLLLSDLQYASDDTRDLVNFVAAHLFDPKALGGDPATGFSGVLMVSLDDDHLFDDVRDTLHHDVFEVKGLSRDDVLSYLATHPALDKLLTASRGRPDDIDALLEHLPADADAFLLERVGALTLQTKAVLEALSVSGRPTTPQLLSEVTTLPLGEVAASLSTLLENSLVTRRLQNGTLLFAFTRSHHEHIIKESIGEEEVARLHEAFGAALEKDPSTSPSQAGLLAHHFLAGAHPQRGIPFALDAVERFLSTFAYGSAVRLAERALKVSTERDQKMALLDRLTSAQRLRGSTQKALDAAEEMRALALPEERATVLRRIGELVGKRSEYKRSLSILAEALDAVSDLPADERAIESARIPLAMADVSYHLGDYEGVEQQAQQTLASSSSALDGESTAQGRIRINVSNLLGKVAYARGHYDDAAQIWKKNQTLAETVGEDTLSLQARLNLGIARFHLGEYDDARKNLEGALSEARAMGDILREATALVNLGAVAQRVSDVGRAIQCLTGAMALFSRLGRREAVRLATWNLANVYTSLGVHETAEYFLDESRRIANLIDSQRGRAFVHLTEGDIAYDRGQFLVAQAAYENARRLFDETSDDGRVFEMKIKMGWSQFKAGEVETASDSIQSAGPAKTDLRQARLDALQGAIFIESDDEKMRTQGAALLTRAFDGFVQETSDEDAWRTALYIADVFQRQGDAKSASAIRQRGALRLKAFVEHLGPDLRGAFTEYLKRTFRFDLETGGIAQPETAAEVQTMAQVAAPSARLPEWDDRYKEIIGSAPSLLRVFDRLDRVTRSNQSTVLIRGESGTGKELVASAIHALGEKRKGPFVRVNCAALVETLLLSELFGHEKGAFTGAFARKEGRFEMAKGGTIFLDEIGDISPKTQVSLLRVLQEKTFERVGGAQTLTTDASIICATHRNLEEMVEEKSFREDLYYRLRGVVIELPALRDRHSDIPRLADTFLKQVRLESGRGPSAISAAAQRILMAYAWPGNIRELQNVIRSVALFCESEIIEPVHLAEFPELFGRVVRRAPKAPLTVTSHSELPAPPLADAPPPTAPASAAPLPSPPQSSAPTGEGLALNDQKKKLEFDAISKAIQQTNGNITQAAKLLKMKRPRLSQIVNGNPELKTLKEACRG